MSDGALSRLYNRLAMMVGRGRIKTVNDAGAVQFTQIQLGADEIRDNMPRLAEYGFTSNPPAGSDAVAAFLTGDRSNGVIIATGHQAYRLVALASGDTALYDSRGQTIWLKSTGIVINANGNDVTVQNAAHVTVTATTSIQLTAPTIKLN